MSGKPIGPLDKIHLYLEIEPCPGNERLETLPSEMVLIYGTGSGGITEFEKMLFEKRTGDEFTLTVDAGSEPLMFGHLQCTMAQAIRMAPPYTLHVTVHTATPASPQEVVKAIAQTTECGGDCGCGCGG